jgi:8-oxo-dGTP pyrophosphatase MutT (NUDIX family)
MEADVGSSHDDLTGSHAPIFGSPVAGVAYEQRLAAYAVIRNTTGAVAAVRASAGYWLPGGGALSGETPEETVVREVREELGRALRLINKIGEAIQYFYAVADSKYYAMRAVFFRAELAEVPLCPAEYEVDWLDTSHPTPLFFHACHDWAILQG